MNGMFINKKLKQMVTELFTKGSKLNNSLVFIVQTYFALPKRIRLNSAHYFIMKIPSKQELQKITFNHSSNIGFKEFMNLYKKCTAKPYLPLVIGPILISDNPSYKN